MSSAVWTDSPIAAAGLLLDIAGALVLAVGLMGKKPGEMIRESTAYYGRNPFQLLAMVRQRADAQVGALLLVLGFGGQFDGSLAPPPSWATLGVMLPLATAVVAAVVALWRLWWAPREVLTAAGAGVLADWIRLDREDNREEDHWAGVLRQWATGLVSERPGENVEKLAARAYGKKWRLLGPYFRTRSIREGGEILARRGESVSPLPDDLG